MYDKDFSSLYDQAKEVINNPPEGVYKKKKSELKKRIAIEQEEYINASEYKKSKKTFIIPIVCICVITTMVFLFISFCDIGLNDIIIDSEKKSLDNNQGLSTTITTTKESISITEKNVLADSITTKTEAIQEISTVTEMFEGTTHVPDENYVESYNGFKIGEIVYYSGTIHYVNSFSNELGGACRAGKAMISAIDPEGIHIFHLVTADDECTVYGWVDETFVNHINES